MGKYSIILWDMDQTLLNFKKSENYAIRHCFAEYGLEIDDEIVALYSSINEGVWKRIEKGEIARENALIERFRLLFEKIGVNKVDAQAFKCSYAKALESVYFYQEDSYELVKSLKGKYSQYIVTNGVLHTQQTRIHLSGFDKLMDGIFISEQVGFHKPQREYFDKCFAEIPDFEKEKTIIVGDSLSSDMLGGNHAGITTCWYNPNGLINTMKVQIDHEIKKLCQIKEVLD